MSNSGSPADGNNSRNNNNQEKVPRDAVDLTNGNETVQSQFNENILTKMNEIIASIIGDDRLTEGDVMTLAYNFSWYFLTDHLRALKQSRYKNVRDNYEKFFLENIVAYLRVIDGHSAIIQYMLNNNLKTIDEYIVHFAKNKNNNSSEGT